MAENSPINPIEQPNGFSAINDAGAISLNPMENSSSGKETTGSALNPEENKIEKASTRVETGIIGTSLNVPKEEKLPVFPGVTNINLQTDNPIQTFGPAPAPNSTETLTKPGETVNQSTNVASSATNQNTVNAPKNITLNNNSSFSFNELFLKSIGIDVKKLSASPSPSSTQTINSTSVQPQNNTVVSNTTTNINGATTESTTTTTTDQTVQPSALNVFAQKKEIDAEKKAMLTKYLGSNFLSMDKKETSTQSTVEKTGETTMLSEKTSSETTEVTKTAPTFNEKIPQSSEKIIEKSNSAVLEKTQEMMAKSSENKENVTLSSTSSSEKNESISSTREEKEMAKGGPTVIDISSLESRLSRLEYLLSNPLEVKIID
jgi:hypothetical protein